MLVGDLQYHGKSALTYAHEDRLMPGSVVRIALKSRAVLGIVQREVPEPTFSAKPIAAIAESPPLPPQALKLIDWLASYYPAPFGSIIRQFLPPTTTFPKRPAPQMSRDATVGSNLPALTTEQQHALASIKPSGYHLLHGITGSGKSRIYLELAQRTLQQDKSAIILTPEIGLTAQLTEPFMGQFPGRVIVIHSRMTPAERRTAWHDILCATAPLVVIGPRSALFAPLKDIGLIVLDESHDQAYKSETAPRYRAERVAATLATLHDACLVSGSATPSIEEYYYAAAKQKPIISLTSLATSTSSDDRISIVDLRDRGNLTRSAIISTALISAIQQSLEQNEQSLLFLNRRGTAGAILCSSCGWQALCDHCDLPLTYHGDTHQVRCHTCGRTRSLPTQCPDCGESDILFKSIGTKAIVSEIERLFPQATIMRFDTDTDRRAQLETQMNTLKSGAVDIIVGTQMITKGLDLPHLSVVGVLSADTSLLVPDYTSSERTYQLLTQVIGRATRGHRPSQVLIQSYAPENAVLRAAAARDWANFYSTELDERRAFRFPPYVHLLKLTCSRATSAAAERAATKLSQQIQKTHPKLIIEGPSAAFHPKEGGKYRWQLIVKSASRQILVDIATTLPSGWVHDLDPAHLL